MPSATFPESDTKPLLAAAWMMGAVASFTAMALAGRAVSLELDTFEILGWRSLIGIVMMVIVLTMRGLWPKVNTKRMDLHLTRNLFHFAAQNFWFFAIFSIPLAQVFALEFTAPLWVLMLSPLLLGEQLTKAKIIAALLGFAGILLVTRPGYVPLTPGLIAAALAAIGFALTYIFTKKLTRVAHTVCILWWMTVSQTIFGFVCAGLDGEIAFPAASALPWVVVIGVTGLTAHFCVASALRIAPATLVMPFDFLRLPVVAIIGMIFYDETIGPLFVAGGILILCGNYLNVRAGTRVIPR